MKKSKEEIGRLGIDYSDLINMSRGITSYSIADAVVYGYNQCKQDADQETKELQSLLDLSEVQLKSSKQDVKELKDEIERLKRIELSYYKLTGCTK
jgi:hypothetical protein